jgi:LysR family transcriptional regulator, low CO2-responsive transcriptional regulator
MNYTLNQLNIFLKVSQLESITKAAEDLHLSQPAVSIQLKNFQDQFDIPLTEIIGRKIFITDFGREVAQAAEKILNEVESLNYKTLQHKGHLSGRLKISVVSTGKYIIPYFLSEFLKENPGVELQMEVTNKAQVIESLEKNEIDFALVSVLPEKLSVEKITLMKNKLFLIANGKYKLKKTQNHFKILEGQKFIYREKGSATRFAMEQFIINNDLPVQKKIELTSNEAVKQAILADLGLSIMPLIGLKNELKEAELQIIPLKGLPLLSSWNIIWLKGKKFTLIADAYIDFLGHKKEEIISEHFAWYENL